MFGHVSLFTTVQGFDDRTPLSTIKEKSKELVQEAFNKCILELRQTFNAKVDEIALEFTGKGPCYSCSQICSQVIYNISTPKKTQKPMLPNAWAHAKAQADHKKSTCIVNIYKLQIKKLIGTTYQ